MSDWGSYIDRQIRKAIEEGEFSNLPGEGKPLNLGEDENTPDEMRMAYKILRENDLAPDWIIAGKDLEARIEQFSERLRQAYQAYRSAASPQAESKWKAAQTALTAAAAKLNREINTYNLKLPPGVTHKTSINLEREISRLMEG